MASLRANLLRQALALTRVRSFVCAASKSYGSLAAAQKCLNHFEMCSGRVWSAERLHMRLCGKQRVEPWEVANEVLI